MKTLKGLLLLWFSGVLMLLSLSSGITAEKPTSGGTVVIGIHADPDVLNPVVTPQGQTRQVLGNVFSRLVYSDLEGNYHGDLAAKWTVSKDNLKIRFELRKGVKWHDGRPVTADDIKFSLESLAKYHARGSELKRGSIVVMNTNAFEINFPSPSVSFFPTLDETGFIIPKHIYGTVKDLTRDPINDNPIGSGPFVFTEWKKGSSITITKNNNYYNKGRPFVDRAAFKIIPSGASRAMSLETGEIDYLAERALPELDAIRLKSKPDFVVTDRGLGPNSLAMLVFNTQRKPWNDIRVRQAVAYAIDKKMMAEKVTSGIAIPAYSAFSKIGTPWAYNSKVEALYHYDLPKASKLLDDAGYPIGPDGFRFTSKILFDQALERFQDASEIIRQELKKININIELQPFDKATSENRVWISRDYDLWIGQTTYGSDPSVGVQRYYVTPAGPPLPFTNANEYSNAEVDKLFSLGKNTIDIKKRGEHYRAVQLILMKDLPILPLLEMPKLAAFTKKLRGIHDKRFYSYYYIPMDAWFTK